MFPKGKAIFNNALKSTCEDELNSLTQEIEWAFKKRRQESQEEVTKLKTALSEYKQKYDSCRLKQKQLLKRHEALKVQYAKLDQSCQEQITSLQEEVSELKNSFQLMWLTDKNSKDTKEKAKEEFNSTEISKLKEEAKHSSLLVEELRLQNQTQQQKQAELQRVVKHLKSQLKQQEQIAERELVRASQPPPVETSQLAEQAQERFLREESIFQDRFRDNLLAKVERLQSKMSL